MLRTTAAYQLVVMKYLHLNDDKRVFTLQEVGKAASRWARHEINHQCFNDISYDQCKARFMQYATNWLRFLNRLEIPPQQLTPDQVAEFIEHDRIEKDLSDTTIRSRHHQLKKFFSRIKETPAEFLAQVTPERLDKLLTQQVRKGIYSPRTIQNRGTILRAFFRYAECRSWCRSGISDSIQAPRVYKHESIPSGPSWEDVQRLLKTTEGNRPCDIRARAILMLLAVYGLRSSEVRNLQLQDLDWQQETLRIKRSKGGPTQLFPLAPTVGRAILRYLKETRPKDSPYQEVFLNARAPYRPVKSLFGVVAYRLEQLNITIKHHGPHSLRHACATRLINEGMSLKTIGDQLGHRNLETTRIYAKVDLPRLRKVADFSMGGVS
jgi:site-specific recombinase XerD